MALLYMYDAKGDPADLLAKYDQAGSAFKGKANKVKHGELSVLAHICVQTADGIRILDLIDDPPGETPGPAGKPLQKGRAPEWFEKHGAVSSQERQTARDAFAGVDYSETTYEVHDFAVPK
jgi:hypothetical protein